MKKALITGSLGQDGSYLIDLLLDKGYEVHGIYRRISSGNNFSNLEAGDAYGHTNLHLHCGDITDAAFMNRLIADVKPDEAYLLAAMSHVGQSFKEPLATFNTNAMATAIALEAFRQHSIDTKIYMALTSEILGGLECPESGYDESAPINPRSPYAAAKAASYHLCRNYRVAYKMFICNGILFNHGGLRRPTDFIERKIANGVAKVRLGLQDYISLGNLDACRDIGKAEEYVEAMWLMLQQDEPDDYIVATGETASIREMLQYTCELAGLDFNSVYRQDDRFMRPSDVPYLKGNPTKIKEKLGWSAKSTWRELIKEMYENDLKELKN